MADAPGGEAPAPASAPATAAEIEEAVNKRLASCNSVKIGDKNYGIKVSFEEAPAAESSGGKRNRRKTRSKRSARKSHKSRRVFGGKRK